VDFSLGEVSTGVRAGLFAFVGLLLAPAAVYLPVSPVRKQQLALEQARQRQAALQSDVARLQGVAAQRAPLEGQVQSDRAELESLESQMPPGKNADEFIHMLEAAAAKSGIHVRRITSKSVVAREFHFEMPLEIEAEGSYFALLDFFTALSRMTRINNVDDLTLAGFPEGSARPRSTPPGATVSATFTVTTFFTRAEDSVVPPGPNLPPKAELR